MERQRLVLAQSDSEAVQRLQVAAQAAVATGTGFPLGTALAPKALHREVAPHHFHPVATDVLLQVPLLHLHPAVR